MHVHRLLVESGRGLSGHPFDFTFDISRLTTNQDFLRDTHMVTVEAITQVYYSEFLATFANDARHPASLLLTWDRPMSYVYGQPYALCHLQQYASQGVYGVTADSAHVPKTTMGVVLQGDTINMAGQFGFACSRRPNRPRILRHVKRRPRHRCTGRTLISCSSFGLDRSRSALSRTTSTGYI